MLVHSSKRGLPKGHNIQYKLHNISLFYMKNTLVFHLVRIIPIEAKLIFVVSAQVISRKVVIKLNKKRAEIKGNLKKIKGNCSNYFMLVDISSVFPVG